MLQKYKKAYNKQFFYELEESLACSTISQVVSSAVGLEEGKQSKDGFLRWGGSGRGCEG